MTVRKPTQVEILDMDAHAVMAAYRKGVLKPSEAVDVYIAHQEKINPKLNLIVEKRYEKAREEALHYDRLLADGKTDAPLFGVPMSIKESIHVGGMHTTGSVDHYKDQLIEKDGNAVRMLRAAGAIVLGKTNTPPLTYCQETDNYLFGRSNNPWKITHTTGGSSGGEAALMAVGGAAAGFGSDIGGSIRIPAHFNGIVGFKPGAHRSQNVGSWPPPESELQWKMVGLGPMVKSMRDAALIYSVIWPEFKMPAKWKLPRDQKIISFGNFNKSRLDGSSSQVLKTVQQALRDAGARVDITVPKLMGEVARAWQIIMAEDGGKEINELAYPGRPFAFLLDYLKAATGMKAEQHPFISWGILGTRLFPPKEKDFQWLETYLREGEAELESLMGDDGVFVIPVYPTSAKEHGKVYREIFSITYSFRHILPFTVFPNTFGLPAISVPCGFSSDGLPVGLQVVSRNGNEALVFQVAAFLEKTLGGYKRCNAYD